jgi:Ca2+-binding RTX toxin-like protein
MIEDIYTEALLAAAAYADWSLLGGPNEFKIKDELINKRGFTEAQYNTLFDSQNPNRLYEVIPNGYTQDLNGFSATVFRNVNETSADFNKLTVSFRGTDDLIDWSTNLNVLLGVDNIITNFIGSQDDNITAFLESAGLVVGGVLQDGVNFTGHSLGGYLATMASYKYASTLGSTSTFNGLGTSISDVISNEIINGISLDGKVNNYYADLVGGIVGIHPGTKTEIFIENESALEDHSIAKLVESLSVYRVLTLIDPILDSNTDFDKIYNILDAATNVAEQSLETIINGLGDLLGGDSAVNTGDVELFYQSLLENDELKPQYQGLTISSLTTVDGDSETVSISAEILKSNAQTSIAYRYALINLNSFVVTGNDAIYNDNNLNGALNRYNPSTGLGLTDEYIEARSSFVQLVIERNLNDYTNDHGYDTTKTALTSESRIYQDNANNITIAPDDNSLVNRPDINNPLLQRVIFGSDENKSELLLGGQREDFLFGGKGNDTLVGGKGTDYLEGGEGNDILIHDEVVGNDNEQDTLKGGQGIDTYFAGFGDVIEDSDGQGLVKLSGDTLRDGYRDPGDPANEYQSSNGTYKYNLDTATNTLAVQLTDNTDPNQILTINSFISGNLGISLNDFTAPAPVEFNGTVDKDIIGVDDTGTQVDLLDSDGNVIGGQTFGSPVQVIRGMEDDDFIQVDADIPNIVIYGDSDGDAPGLDGNDFIEVDRINVFNDTTPTDFTQGATIYGEAGDDFISGSQRNDFIHGQEDHDFIKGNDGADIIYGSTGNDFIEGGKNGNGMDLLYGGDDNDYVLGGAGTDLILGGAGDDRLYGDANSQGFFRNQTGTFYDGATQTFNIFNDPFSNFQSALTEVDVTEAGDDFIDGGLGNDQLYGGAGNDTLNGGADKDTLQGEAGNDFLKGEAGEDTLWGDKDPDSFDKDNQSIQGSTQTETFIFRLHADGKDVAGDDILDGGTDNDKLYGGQGNDTYRFGFGYGKDFVLDEAGDFDKIELGAGITPDNVELDVDDAKNNLIIKLKFDNGAYTGDELTISNWFNGNEVESIQFASGLSWTSAFIENATGVTSNPTAPSDSISTLILTTESADVGLGDDNNNEIHLLGGNDIAGGGSGDDRIFGGEGDDELQGNNGDDILQGDEGNDRLFGQLGNDQLYGGAGDDDLFGNEGNDSLNGGTGADNLSGGTGNDTYNYARGDGDDLILDDAGNDRIVLGEGISASDISVQRQGNDLVLLVLPASLPGTGLSLSSGGITDSITIADWFNTDNQIETIQFDDGSSWDVATITSLLPDDNDLVNNQTTLGSDKASVYRFQPSADMTNGFNITLNDAGGIDSLLFEQASLTIPGSGTFFATPNFDSFNRDGNDLVLNVSVNSQIGTIPDSTGQVRITNYYSQTGFIETIQFPDQILNNPNFAPVLNDTAQDQIILSDTLYTYQLDADSFTDTALDLLNIKASLSDGSALLAWLSFDATTLTFSGTPTDVNDQYGLKWRKAA